MNRGTGLIVAPLRNVRIMAGAITCIDAASCDSVECWSDDASIPRETTRQKLVFYEGFPRSDFPERVVVAGAKELALSQMFVLL